MHLWFAFIENAPRVFASGAAATVILEAVHRWLTGRSIPYRQWGLSAVAGFTFLGSKLIFGYALIAPLHLFVFRFRLLDLDLWNPFVWLAIFLLRDLVSYAVHRMEHSITWLWASHSIHHSFQEMSPSCAVRVPWMENLYKIPAGLWMPLLGVDFRLVVGIDVIAALVSIAQHTELFPAKPNGLIQRVFIVPSHHRVHHGSNDHYLDKNFGAVLCVWDRAVWHV
ncbi:MAG: sterol desaturase family protein [Acidimicrobiales bacterium]